MKNGNFRVRIYTNPKHDYIYHGDEAVDFSKLPVYITTGNSEDDLQVPDNILDIEKLHVIEINNLSKLESHKLAVNLINEIGRSVDNSGPLLNTKLPEITNELHYTLVGARLPGFDAEVFKAKLRKLFKSNSMYIDNIDDFVDIVNDDIEKETPEASANTLTARESRQIISDNISCKLCTENFTDEIILEVANYDLDETQLLKLSRLCKKRKNEIIGELIELRGELYRIEIDHILTTSNTERLNLLTNRSDAIKIITKTWHKNKCKLLTKRAPGRPKGEV